MPVLALPWPLWIVVAPLFYLFWGIVWYIRNLFTRPLWTLAQTVRTLALGLGVALTVVFFVERNNPESDIPLAFLLVPAAFFLLFAITFIPRLFRSPQPIAAPVGETQETHHYHHYVHHYAPSQGAQAPARNDAAPPSQPTVRNPDQQGGSL